MTGVKWISCKRSIDRVYQDAGLEVNISDAIEWVGDVLDFVGQPLLLKNIVTNGVTDEDGITHPPIPIVAYRASIPTDLHKVIGVLDYETKKSLYEITDSFFKSYGSQDFPNLLQEGSYTVNNNYFFTGYESGYLEVSYSAYALDNEGFPLIPDNTRLVRAITSYIIERLDYRLLRSGRITPNLYNESYKKYCFDIGSAYNAVNIPSVDGMESWKRARIQLIPRIKLHALAFRQPDRYTTSNMLNKINDRFSIVGDVQSVLLNVSIYGISATNSTNSVLFWNFINSGNSRTLNIYSNVAKTIGYLVAHCTANVLDGNTLVATVLADNSSGLSGILTFNISQSGVINDTDSGNLIVVTKP